MGKLYFPAYRRPKTTLKTPHLRITLYPKAARSSLFWHYFCNFYIYSFTEFENSINLTKSLASFGLCSKHVSYSPMDLRMPKRQCNLQIAWAVSSHAFFPTSTSGSQWHYVPLWLARVRKKKKHISLPQVTTSLFSQSLPETRNSLKATDGSYSSVTGRVMHKQEQAVGWMYDQQTSVAEHSALVLAKG